MYNIHKTDVCLLGLQQYKTTHTHTAIGFVRIALKEHNQVEKWKIFFLNDFQKSCRNAIEKVMKKNAHKN